MKTPIKYVVKAVSPLGKIYLSQCATSEELDFKIDFLAALQWREISFVSIG